MALSDRQIRRQTEERVVKIIEVNTTTGFISMTDQYGTQLRASLDFTTPVVSIPNVGDTWIVQRRNTSWYLVRQQNAISNLSSLGPGDTRITGQRVFINDVDISAPSSNGASVAMIIALGG